MKRPFLRKSINSHPAYLFLFFTINILFFYPEIFQNENALQTPFDVEFKNGPDWIVLFFDHVNRIIIKLKKCFSCQNDIAVSLYCYTVEKVKTKTLLLTSYFSC